MEINEQLQGLITDIVEAHYDALWTANVAKASDIDAFEDWCAATAKHHASITLRFIYTNDEFEALVNGEDKPAEA